MGKVICGGRLIERDSLRRDFLFIGNNLDFFERGDEKFKTSNWWGGFFERETPTYLWDHIFIHEFHNNTQSLSSSGFQHGYVQYFP